MAGRNQKHWNNVPEEASAPLLQEESGLKDGTRPDPWSDRESLWKCS